MLTGPGIALILALVALASAASVLLCLARIARDRRATARLAALIAAPSGSSLAELADHVLTRQRADGRTGHRHRDSGLPTREPLLRTIAADGAGQLGVVTFADFDRLAAFDPVVAGRIATLLAHRLQRMAGQRAIAHVDRHQYAMWFADDAASSAADQLAAVRYALGNRLTEGALSLVPDIRVALVDHASSAMPESTLARAMALASESADITGAAIAPADERARDDFALEQDLRQAIDRGELEAQFQPLIDAEQGRVVGAEALLRWQHPDRGAVGPATFIPMVEAAGLIHEVGLWMLNTACREARRWQRAGLHHTSVAVNVSNRQIASADMLLMIERTLARHALSPRCLEIELTESAAAHDVARTRQLFDALRALGTCIAIDDFGTGFSSLTALRSLSFDKLKIDREFVTEVDRRRDSQAICQSIIALGRGLGITVLAEGVERIEEYAWLRRHGCTYFQGYYFSPPLTGDAFIRFAADRVRLAALLALEPRAIQTQLQQRLS